MQMLHSAGYREFTVCVVSGQERVLEDWARVMQVVGE